MKKNVTSFGVGIGCWLYNCFGSIGFCGRLRYGFSRRI
jgi:hypothetical protein